MEAGSIFVTDGYPGLVVLPKMVKTGHANMATPSWWSYQGSLPIAFQRMAAILMVLNIADSNCNTLFVSNVMKKDQENRLTDWNF